ELDEDAVTNDTGHVVENLTNQLSVLGVTVFGAYVESSATSTVTIGAATLTAGRDVRVSANSVSSAQMKAVSAFLGVTWVHSAASATATVGSGANVSAGANFALTADVTNTMTAKTYVVTGLAGVPQGPSVSVSVGKAESTSRAVVQSGATIS